MDIGLLQCKCNIYFAIMTYALCCVPFFIINLNFILFPLKFNLIFFIQHLLLHSIYHLIYPFQEANSSFDLALILFIFLSISQVTIFIQLLGTLLFSLLMQFVQKAQNVCSASKMSLSLVHVCCFAYTNWPFTSFGNQTMTRPMTLSVIGSYID